MTGPSVVEVDSIRKSLNYDFVDLRIAGERVKTQYADTQQKRYTGLSDTDELEKNEGMLFEYPTEKRHRLVMRDMDFALDVVHIGSDGRVNKWGSMSESGEAVEGISKYAVELPHGWCEKNGVAVGDPVHLLDPPEDKQKLFKGRRYVDDPSEAPDDASVEEGPQGGLYYETEGSVETENESTSPDSSPTFTNTTEAEKYLFENFVDSDERENVDIEGMDVEVANAMVNGFRESIEDWNVPKPRKIEYTPGAGYAGQMQGGTFRISDLDDVDRSERRIGDPPLQRGIGVEGIVRHELGHKLQSSLELYTNARSENILRSLLGSAYYGRDRHSGQTGFYDDSFANEDPKEVSQYASTDPNEYFAEAWTAYVQDEKSVIEDRLREFFDEVVNILQNEGLDSYSTDEKYEFNPEDYITTPVGEREGEGQ